MTISVVIPALDEAECIVRTVESVVVPGVEVVDGGSRDRTCRLARNAGARILVSPRGRARQLWLGCQESSGSTVLFLHADTNLESGWHEAVREALSDPACAGGACAFRFAECGSRQRWIERGVALRVGLFQLPYGDQALFLRRSVLEKWVECRSCQ